MKCSVIRPLAMAGAVAGLALLTVSCAPPSPIQSGPAAAAVVTEADFLCRVDMRAARQTPIVKKLRELRDASERTDAALARHAERRKRLQNATGLGDDDVVSVLVTANLAALDLKGAGPTGDLENVSCVMVVALAKPMTAAQLQAGARILAEGDGEIQVSETAIGERPAIMFRSPAIPGAAGYATMSVDGKAVFLTLDDNALLAALDREKSRSFAALTPSLTAADQVLPKESQIRAVFVPPDSLRQKVRDEVAKIESRARNDAKEGMRAGLVKPFANLQGLSLDLLCGTDVKTTLAVTLAANRTRCRPRL